MPRPLRITYPGAWYHIMNPGLGRRKIFLTGEERELLLNQKYTLAILGSKAFCKAV
jgi:hypothetical protein